MKELLQVSRGFQRALLWEELPYNLPFSFNVGNVFLVGLVENHS